MRREDANLSEEEFDIIEKAVAKMSELIDMGAEDLDETDKQARNLRLDGLLKRMNDPAIIALLRRAAEIMQKHGLNLGDLGRE
jgi:hypothetical protein